MLLFLRWFYVGALLAVAAPSFAQVHLDISIGPPAARSETVLSPTDPHAIWIPGYYSFNKGTGSYVWVAGHYVLPPAQNVTWIAPQYKKHGNHLDYYAGHWDNGKHKGWYKQKHKDVARGGRER